MFGTELPRGRCQGVPSRASLAVVRKLPGYPFTGAFPRLGEEFLVVPFGIAIHMSLAILLGVAITVLLRLLLPRLSGTAFEPVAVTGMLVAVWATNFFVILPALNPAFVSLVPYGVSLISKVLFGVMASFVLQLTLPRHPYA